MKVKLYAVVMTIFSVTGLLIVLTGPPAKAAPVEDVLRACDNTPGCDYKMNEKNGDISGCSKKVCFYCPSDGKRECYQVRKVPVGKQRPVLLSPDIQIK